MSKSADKTAEVPKENGKESSRQAARGVALLLERCTLEDWDRFLDGELTADDLRERYRRGGGK